MSFEALYEAVQTRPRPDDVAELVLDALNFGGRDSKLRRLLDMAARNSTRRMAKRYSGYASSMRADFSRPVGVAKQAKVASELFGVETLTAAQAMDPDAVEAFVRAICPQIGKVFGENDFLANRLNREQRKASGVEFVGHRAYNKRFRLLCRLERKIIKLAAEQRKYRLTRASKSALATQITFEDFSADLNTACLVAYLSSRMSLRSTFTNTSQVRAYDEVAAGLYARCARSATTRWDVVAMVMPDEKVLRRLTDEQKGNLLGQWWGVLTEAAELLRDLVVNTHIDTHSMIVRRGNDSTTWNQAAGAWNKAREGWISVLHAMGTAYMLDSMCPGKVMRLMAADVAYWHRASGGDVHPDTKVWRALPKPWEVLLEDVPCTREMVISACQAADVQPSKWAGPKRNRKAVKFTPTPELVHGVTVSSPSLALALRKAGVFSGKASKGAVDVHVVRDEHGFALEAQSPEGTRDHIGM